MPDRDKLLAASKRYFRLALLALAVMIAALAIESRVHTGDRVSIPLEDLPVYGSAEQDSMGGWVQLTATRLTYVGSTSLNTKVGSRILSSETWDIYGLEDDQGNLLLMRHYNSIGVSGMGSDPAADLPRTLVLRLEGSAKQYFSSYDGNVSFLQAYPDYQIATEYSDSSRYTLGGSSGPTRYIVDERGTMVHGILDKAALACGALAIVMYILSVRSKKKAREALENEPVPDGN